MRRFTIYWIEKSSKDVAIKLDSKESCFIYLKWPWVTSFNKNSPEP